jgi:hypothetical protein
MRVNFDALGMLIVMITAWNDTFRAAFWGEERGEEAW